MAFQSKIGSTTQRTTTGTQAVTGVGFQPKAIILTWGPNTADGGAADSGMGYCYATYNGSTITQHAVYTVGDDAIADTAGYTWCDPSAVLVCDAGGSTLGIASISAVGSDGFTLNWTSTDGVARIINYICLGGADLSAASGYASKRTSTGTQTVSGLGFTPGAVLLCSTNDRITTMAGEDGIYYGLGLGWMTATAQGVSSIGSRSFRSTGDSVSSQFTNAALLFDGGGDGILGAAVYSAFGSGSFTLNWTVASARASVFLWLALGGASMSFYAGAVNSATSTGTQAVTGVGFQPELVLNQSWGKVASTSIQNNGRKSFGAANSTTERFVRWIGGSAGTASSSEDSYLSRTRMMAFVTDGTPTLDGDADFSTFGSDGFTYNWTDASPGAYQILYLAMRGASASGTTYEDSFTLSSSSTLASAGGMTFRPSMTLGAQGAMSPGSSSSLLSSLALASQTGISASALSSLISSIVLAEQSGVALTGGNSFTGSLSLPATISLTDQGAIAALAAMALTQQAGVTASGSLAVQALLSIGGAVGTSITSVSSLVASCSAAVAAAVALGFGSTITESLAFQARSGSSLASAAQLVASTVLTAQAGFSAQASASLVAAVSPSIVTGIIAGYGNTLAGSLSMGVQSSTAMLARQILSASISLAESLGITEGAFLATSAAMDLDAQLQASLNSSLSMGAALAMLQSMGISVSELSSAIVAAMVRRMFISAEDRFLQVDQDSRFIRVQSEDRFYRSEVN